MTHCSQRSARYKRSKACLYLNKLADVDQAVLEEIVRRSYAVTESQRSP